MDAIVDSRPQDHRHLAEPRARVGLIVPSVKRRSEPQCSSHVGPFEIAEPRGHEHDPIIGIIEVVDGDALVASDLKQAAMHRIARPGHQQVEDGERR